VEVGTGGGPASTASGESLQISCEWTSAFSCWSKGVFQPAGKLRGSANGRVKELLEGYWINLRAAKYEKLPAY